MQWLTVIPNWLNRWKYLRSIGAMRTEIANLADEIKQSLGLLRRYL